MPDLNPIGFDPEKLQNVNIGVIALLLSIPIVNLLNLNNFTSLSDILVIHSVIALGILVIIFNYSKLFSIGSLTKNKRVMTYIVNNSNNNNTIGSIQNKNISIDKALDNPALGEKEIGYVDSIFQFVLILIILLLDILFFPKSLLIANIYSYVLSIILVLLFLIIVLIKIPKNLIVIDSSKLIHVAVFYALQADPHSSENLKEKLTEAKEAINKADWTSLHDSLKKMDDEAGYIFLESIDSQEKPGIISNQYRKLLSLNSEPDKSFYERSWILENKELSNLRGEMKKLGFFSLNKKGNKVDKHLNEIINQLEKLNKKFLATKKAIFMKNNPENRTVTENDFIKMGKEIKEEFNEGKNLGKLLGELKKDYEAFFKFVKEECSTTESVVNRIDENLSYQGPLN